MSEHRIEIYAATGIGVAIIQNTVKSNITDGSIVIHHIEVLDVWMARSVVLIVVVLGNIRIETVLEGYLVLPELKIYIMASYVAVCLQICIGFIEN